MEELVNALEQIVYGAVAITNVALQRTAGSDLTLTQWRAIVVVGKSPEGRRVTEVAREVRVTVPATSRLLKRLARRGFIALSADENDGRATRARLTAEGAELRSSVLASRRQQLEQIAADVDLPPSAHAAVLDLAKRFERETA